MPRRTQPPPSALGTLPPQTLTRRAFNFTDFARFAYFNVRRSFVAPSASEIAKETENGLEIFAPSR